MLSEGAIKRIIERERLARKAAEKILEKRTLELYRANDQLKRLNQRLEGLVKEQTDDLRGSEALFRSMVESSSDIIIKASSSGICTYMNPAVTYILGYLEGEIIGKHFLRFVPKDFRKKVKEFYRIQLEERENECYLEFPVMAKNGKKVWIGQKVHFSLQKGKEVKEVIGIAREITEQKLAEEMIRRSEEKYRGIIENMHLGLMEVSNDGIIMEAYDGFCKMTGYKRHELEKQHISMLLTGRKTKDPEGNYYPVITEKTPEAFEMQLRTRQKGLIWVLISAAPIFDDRGTIKGSIRIHMDISEQKKMQENLLQAKLLAEKSKRVEQEFLANMSHEIRTPLNSIIGMTEMLFDTRLDNEQHEYLEVLSHSSKILQQLISTVLDISKIEAGQWVREDAPFDLRQLVEAMQKSFSYRLQEKQVKVSANIDLSITNYLIGDKSWLNQILVNLMGNSAKFTEEGKIELQVKIVRSERRTRWINFRISDTGIGIPEAMQARIFDSFQQGHDKIGHQYGGTGLGLAICKKLVELQGGEISVSSKEGEGSVFTFTLPYEDSEMQIREIPPAGEEKLPSQRHFKGLKLLLVEDNELNHSYMEKVLRKWEVEFTITENGKQAIKQLEKGEFDLILMDIQMPEMNGYEASRHIRKMKANANAAVPIIALTASALLDERKKALNSGMNEHLAKPFTPDQLYKVINQFIPEKKRICHAEQMEHYINRNQLAALYGNDETFMKSMIRKFLSNTPEYIQLMKTYFYHRRWNDLEKVAHKCKPTFGMVGLSRIQDLVEQIEQQSRGLKNVSESERILKQIIHENNRARKYLEQIANKSNL